MGLLKEARERVKEAIIGRRDPDVRKFISGIADGTSTHPIMNTIRSQVEGTRLDIQDYGETARVNIIKPDRTEISYIVRKREDNKIEVKKEGTYAPDK